MLAVMLLVEALNATHPVQPVALPVVNGIKAPHFAEGAKNRYSIYDPDDHEALGDYEDLEFYASLQEMDEACLEEQALVLLGRWTPEAWDRVVARKGNEALLGANPYEWSPTSLMVLFETRFSPQGTSLTPTQDVPELACPGESEVVQLRYLDTVYATVDALKAGGLWDRSAERELLREFYGLPIVNIYKAWNNGDI
jgi:hypothetical protein